MHVFSHNSIHYFKGNTTKGGISVHMVVWKFCEVKRRLIVNTRLYVWHKVIINHKNIFAYAYHQTLQVLIERITYTYDWLG